MNQQGLLALARYDAYANGLVLDTVAQLAEGAWHQEVSPSHGSVHKLLQHMMDCEEYFFSVCHGQPLEELPAPSTVVDLRRYWFTLTQEIEGYVASRTDSDLERVVVVPLSGGTVQLPVWQALLQAFVHSIHHRGELSIVLTELGHPVPTLDIVLQFLQQSGQEWAPSG